MTEADYKSYLEAVDGLLVINTQGKIVYLAENLAWLSGNKVKPELLIGMDVRDVFPENRLIHTLTTQKPQYGDIYTLEGYTLVSNRKPLYREGKLIGALEYDIFGDSGEHFHSFMKQLETISENMDADIKVGRKNRGARYGIENIIGVSRATEELKKQIDMAAHTDSTVVIDGETGCGKELVAHSIHSQSQRMMGELIRLNCSEIPESLFESELFGYEQGAFTGANKEGKKGKMELANGGTILLDEINSLPLSQQPKLLRALQEREINKVGGKYSIPIDVRVIVTTNEDLWKLVEEGRFRKDLYFRLNVINIHIPPLRERPQDIRPMTYHFIQSLNRSMNRNVQNVKEDVFAMLERHPWNGNVRELRNAIEGALNLCYTETLEIQHFVDFIRKNTSDIEESLVESEIMTFRKMKKDAERKLIVTALKRSQGNKVEAAKLLEISKSLIHKKIVSYGIEKDEY